MFCSDIIGPLVKRVMRALGINTKTQKNFIAPEQTVDTIDTGNPGTKAIGFHLADVLATPPDKLFFSVDGVVSECHKKEVDGATIYGNLSLASAEFDDSGESFVFMFMGGETYTEGFVKTEADSVTISVWEQTETTTPISDKYLPGVCLPFVELSTELTKGESTLSSADGEALDKVVGIPCVLAVRFNGVAYRSVFSFLDDGSDIAFSGAPYDANIIVARSKDGGNWMAIVTPALA